MAFHAGATLLARRLMRAPIFFAAVGSQANVEPMPPLAVKGKREPVRSYVLLDLVPAQEGRAPAVDSEE